MGNYWLFLLLIASFIALGNSEKVWWQKAVIYQIYPRSFKDSNGDGIGDLKGIIQGLDHIKDAGVENIWLSPIYKSPMYDFGYDISDFKEIQPEYGTMQDFEDLVKEASKLGIRVILDFVPNHGSNESDWFNLSVNKTKGYEDYFVWADGKADPNNPKKLIPPSNWNSAFRKSAWEYNDVRKQFYLHQFAIAQPDLNYRNPLVVKEMKDVLRFWLNKGVAGFRIDAINHLFEVDPDDFGGEYPDEPRSNVVGLDPEEHAYYNHIYTMNQNPTYDMVYQWREVLDEYERKDGLPRVILTEAYADVKLVMRYYGNATHNGSSLPFNFQYLREITKDSDARDVKYVIDKWLTYMPVGRTPNWVNGNHDNNRMASRHGVERADIMNMLALLLPGTALTYQGEELAMTDGEVTWEETKDPAACNTNDPINYYKTSRDPARTPFHWDDGKNAGFTTGNYTWLPVASNYREVNLKSQLLANKSHYKFYRDLVALKKRKTLTDGKLDLKVLTEDILVLLRHYPGEPIVVSIANLSPVDVNIDLSSLENVSETLTVYASSLNSRLEKGQKIQSKNVMLSPYDAIVFTG